MKIKDPKLIQLILIGLPILFFISIASSWTYLSEKIILLGLLLVGLQIKQKSIKKYEEAHFIKFNSDRYILLISIFGIIWTTGCLFFSVMDNRLLDRKLINYSLYGAVQKFSIYDAHIQLIKFGLWNNSVEESGTFTNAECMQILISEKEMLNLGNGKSNLLEKGKPYLFRDCDEVPEN